MLRLNPNQRHFVIETLMGLFWVACGCAVGGMIYHIGRKLCAC